MPAVTFRKISNAEKKGRKEFLNQKIEVLHESSLSINGPTNTGAKISLAGSFEYFFLIEGELLLSYISFEISKQNGVSNSVFFVRKNNVCLNVAVEHIY